MTRKQIKEKTAHSPPPRVDLFGSVYIVCTMKDLIFFLLSALFNICQVDNSKSWMFCSCPSLLSVWKFYSESFTLRPDWIMEQFHTVKRLIRPYLSVGLHKDGDDKFFCTALNNIVNWCQGTWCKQSLAPLGIPVIRHSRPCRYAFRR